MRFRPPLRVSVTRHEEKEHKLQAVPVAATSPVSSPAATSPTSRICCCRPVARQPGRQGHLGARDDIAAAGLGARLILAHVDRDPAPEDWGRDDPVHATRSAGRGTRAWSRPTSSWCSAPRPAGSATACGAIPPSATPTRACRGLRRGGRLRRRLLRAAVACEPAAGEPQGLARRRPGLRPDPVVDAASDASSEATVGTRH